MFTWYRPMQQRIALLHSIYQTRCLQGRHPQHSSAQLSAEWDGRNKLAGRINCNDRKGAMWTHASLCRLGTYQSTYTPSIQYRVQKAKWHGEIFVPIGRVGGGLSLLFVKFVCLSVVSQWVMYQFPILLSFMFHLIFGTWNINSLILTSPEVHYSRMSYTALKFVRPVEVSTASAILWMFFFLFWQRHTYINGKKP